MKKDDTQTEKKQEQSLSKKKNKVGRELNGIFLALLIALTIRSCVFEPYNIPSGSMIPTLLIGDYLFITKYDYGYSRHSFPFSAPIIPHGKLFGKAPKQGDVVIFRMTPKIQPQLSGNIDYIKRVIGLPGDTVQMVNGRLYINDKIVDRQLIGSKTIDTEAEKTTFSEYAETLPNGVVHTIFENNDTSLPDNTEKFTVPQEHFFVMGDNRDNSLDSRFFGAVPFTNLEGKARFIFYSNNGKGSFWQFWRWPEFIRINRLFTGIE